MSTWTFEDVLGADSRALAEIMRRAAPFDPAAIAGWQYHGVDLSLPGFATRLLWKTFRKAFVDDGAGGVRGWNVRMVQHGVHGAREPMRRPDGSPWSFAHYRVRSAAGLRFPRGWEGAWYLDYRDMGNPLGESLAFTPLVAVNPGRDDLLLGWEVFRVGGFYLPLPDYWVLRRDGPVEDVVPAPRDRRA
jgi:hypothetical protein